MARVFTSCISFDSYIKPQRSRGKRLTASRCISFDSYIKPQQLDCEYHKRRVVYLLIPTSNHNASGIIGGIAKLYIFWFLHQTTTCISLSTSRSSCISFDSYIKPQQLQLAAHRKVVVYLLIPTSNHNSCHIKGSANLLYIFWFLHQTTTCCCQTQQNISCISFDSYIKPQPACCPVAAMQGCISFDSYIKPQLRAQDIPLWPGCISFDSYIKPQPRLKDVLSDSVVYLLIPTSNHNK